MIKRGKPSETRPLSPEDSNEDNQQIEQGLRPHMLKDYIGQEDIKKSLGIALAAAKKRDESLEHTLIHGPPGLGKTTLAHIMAREMGVNIRVTSGPALEKQGDLASIISNLRERDILFIDEIHRLNPAVEEILYPAMED
ncbi:AAA family ATPase, partial [Candidatus Peregrinibacteria bacterium]|nr:AAA family ATPase [Candidatus Peregrinibacteria bacterium]